MRIYMSFTNELAQPRSSTSLKESSDSLRTPRQNHLFADLHTRAHGEPGHWWVRLHIALSDTSSRDALTA